MEALYLQIREVAHELARQDVGPYRRKPVIALVGKPVVVERFVPASHAVTRRDIVIARESSYVFEGFVPAHVLRRAADHDRKFGLPVGELRAWRQSHGRSVARQRVPRTL